jgi:hypothetical protein
MDQQLVIICLLTAIINLIGTLAYAARIAGVRTGRIAMSFALFNILVLVSRTSNSFLGPFLAKRIETRIAAGGGERLAFDFQIVLASASLAVFLGILLVPTGQRLFARAIATGQPRKWCCTWRVRAGLRRSGSLPSCPGWQTCANWPARAGLAGGCCWPICWPRR